MYILQYHFNIIVVNYYAIENHPMRFICVETASYVMKVIACPGTIRRRRGTIPFHNAKTPSSRATTAIPDNNPVYFGGRPGTTTCFCNLVFITSNGLLTSGPIPPENPPIASDCHGANSVVPCHSINRVFIMLYAVKFTA